jgi:hypothetical protein
VCVSLLERETKRKRERERETKREGKRETVCVSTLFNLFLPRVT